MKLLEPIKVGNIEFKNRIMFPPLTTGYEEKDGSIGEQSFRFYERLAKGGVGYIVIGDVAPLSTKCFTREKCRRQEPNFTMICSTL